MKNFVENYKLIRKNLYEDVFSSLKLHGWKKKYSKIKALLCIEIGAFLTFFALKFKVKPNTITLLFVLLVVIATILLSSKNNILVIIGLFIFFLKNTLDLIDGHIARVTKQTSNIGHILDIWGGAVSHIFFQIATCLYVYSRTSDAIFLVAILIICVLSLLDFKKHYLFFSEKEEQKKFTSDWKTQKEKIKNNFYGLKKQFVKIFLILDYDGRSRYTDLVILIILVEIFKNQLIITTIIPYLWVATNIVKFLYKFYLIINVEKNK